MIGRITFLVAMQLQQSLQFISCDTAIIKLLMIPSTSNIMHSVLYMSNSSSPQVSLVAPHSLPYIGKKAQRVHYRPFYRPLPTSHFFQDLCVGVLMWGNQILHSTAKVLSMCRHKYKSYAVTSQCVSEYLKFCFIGPFYLLPVTQFSLCDGFRLVVPSMMLK